MEIIETSKLEKVCEPWGLSIKLFKSEAKKVEIGLFSVDPNKSMNMHKHETEDELIYVLEGEANFIVNGEEAELSEGSAVLIPRQTLHKASNNKTEQYWCFYVVCPMM